MWESDLVQFWRARRPFHVRDVTTDDHRRVIEEFAADHGLKVSREGATVLFDFQDL